VALENDQHIKGKHKSIVQTTCIFIATAMRSEKPMEDCHDDEEAIMSLIERRRCLWPSEDLNQSSGKTVFFYDFSTWGHRYAEN